MPIDDLSFPEIADGLVEIHRNGERAGYITRRLYRAGTYGKYRRSRERSWRILHPCLMPQSMCCLASRCWRDLGMP